MEASKLMRELKLELARVTAERDTAERERVSVGFRLANAEVQLRQAQARIAELEARLDQGLWSRL